MSHYFTQKTLPFCAAHLFGVVADVECYSAFVPFCESLQVLKVEQKAGGVQVLEARMCVAFKAFRESYTSRVTLDLPNLRIDVEAIDGPFAYLKNTWEFAQLTGDSCKVDFMLDYKFKNKLLGFAMSAVFDKVFGRYMDAFIERARQLELKS